MGKWGVREGEGIPLQRAARGIMEDRPYNLSSVCVQRCSGNLNLVTGNLGTERYTGAARIGIGLPTVVNRVQGWSILVGPVRPEVPHTVELEKQSWGEAPQGIKITNTVGF